ncbi:MAG: hypothetical protein KUG72_03600 [Pseudomonadales bacterium]|nr:hypothetical protein [Pseudomonadales bacterium]
MQSDVAPEYECAKCGAIYSKVEAAIKRKSTKTYDAVEKGTRASIDQEVLHQQQVSQGIQIDRKKRLSKCKACGKSVSKSAKICLHCREKDPVPSPPRSWLLILLAVLIVVWIIVTKPFTTISHESPVDISENYSLSFTLQKYLERNFAAPGFAASWHSNILSVQVIGNTAIVKTDLPKGSRKLTYMCGAVSGFIYDRGRSSLNISRVKIVSPNGSTLLHRASVSHKCNLL